MIAAEQLDLQLCKSEKVSGLEIHFSSHRFQVIIKGMFKSAQEERTE